MNNISEIDVKAASAYCGREQYVNRRMDRWIPPYYNTTDFSRGIKW